MNQFFIILDLIHTHFFCFYRACLFKKLAFCFCFGCFYFFNLFGHGLWKSARSKKFLFSVTLHFQPYRLLLLALSLYLYIVPRVFFSLFSPTHLFFYHMADLYVCDERGEPRSFHSIKNWKKILFLDNSRTPKCYLIIK